MTNVTDIKKFIELFSNNYQLKPEHQSQLEEYKDSSEDFKMTLQYLASKMNQSGKTHIILIDEVDLKNVLSRELSKENHLELDLSYISEYENIHFIFCLRPAKDGVNDFTLSFPSVQSNQYFVCLRTTYRNTQAIQKLIKYFQTQIDAKSEGYALMGNIPNFDKLPPPLIPSSYHSSVIWIPTIPSVEDAAVDEISSLLSFEDLDKFQDEGNPSVAILYTNKISKDLARKLLQKNVAWYGPLEDVNYNGSEADVVVIISDGDLNIQTFARARRLLMILTMEKEWYYSRNLFWKLEKAITLDLAEIIRLGDCPYRMIKCERCQSKFDEKSIYYHILEQCQNYWKGSEWKLPKSHTEESCIYTYRNTEVIQRFIKNFQSQSDTKSEGHAMMADSIPVSDNLPPSLIPLGYNSSVIWFPTIPSVEDEALKKIYHLLLFQDLDEIHDKGYPSVAILYTNHISKNLARKLFRSIWYGPLQDVNYNCSEADVVVFISNSDLNIQTFARARRLLIILTMEKDWYYSRNIFWKLEKAIAWDIVEVIRLGDCSYGMIKCEVCQSKFDENSINYHVLEQGNVKCQDCEDCIYMKM